MSEMVKNVVVACGECFASGVPFVTRYIWYHNQHGARVRVFCHVCGCVTDKTERKGIVSTELKTFPAEIRYPRPDNRELPF